MVKLRIGDDKTETCCDFYADHEGDSARAALDDIENGNPSRGQIKLFGELLWNDLVHDEVLAAFEKAFHGRNPGDHATIRLGIPTELRWMPWETLYYDKKGWLAGQDDCSLILDPSKLSNVPPSPGPLGGKVRLLIIVPESSKLFVQREIDQVTRNFQRLGIGDPTLLSGRVTHEVLNKKLRDEGPWHIVHFIGHGRVNEDETVELELDTPEGSPNPFSGEDFAIMLQPAGVRLALMNCCHGGAALGNDPLCDFAPLLMREGVPAVVAMRYSIGNETAATFADIFYEQLFTGKSPGRVDRAMEEGRSALRRANNSGRDFITPVLHLAPGYAQLFAFAAPSTRPFPASVASVAARTVGTDEPAPPKEVEEAANALRSGQCVLVLGAGLLNPVALRDRGFADDLVDGPREIATRLAGDRDCPYPRAGDLRLADHAGDWINAQILQWVIQLQQSKRRRGKVVKAIQDYYDGRAVPPLLREITRWKVPAVFYLHFDSYLEGCVLRKESWLTNVVYEFDKPLDNQDLGSGGPRSLVLIRGSYNSTQYPLVISEDDHEQLSLRIQRLDPQLKRTARKADRSVLFMGVSPRDPVVRQLSMQLLEPGDERVQGPTFFACAQHDEVDDAYWKKFDVKWLSQDLRTLVRHLSKEVSRHE